MQEKKIDDILVKNKLLTHVTFLFLSLLIYLNILKLWNKFLAFFGVLFVAVQWRFHRRFFIFSHSIWLKLMPSQILVLKIWSTESPCRNSLPFCNLTLQINISFTFLTASFFQYKLLWKKLILYLITRINISFFL